MSQKLVEIEGIGTVLLAKRRGARSLRLSIKPNGTVRVGMPPWVPYASGINFAAERKEWINRHLAEIQPVLLADGQRIGKSFRLQLKTEAAVQRTRTRIAANTINIRTPHAYTSRHVQSAAQAACERALRREAERLLPYRLSELADEHGFDYSEVKIKRLTSRWGSCSDKGQIVLSYFLVQLPWELIDYVILHELTHTRHLNHSRQFWQSLERILPDASQSRREIRKFRPVLTPS